MNVWIKTALAVTLIIIIAAVFYFTKHNKKEDVMIIHDTNVIKKYEKEIIRDTVYNFRDKIVYKKSVPEKIYVQRVDTVFTDRISSFDLPLRIEKKGDEMNVKAINLEDSVLKEYVFRDIGRDFVLTPLRRNLKLKTRNYYFDKPILSVSLNYELSGGNGNTYYAFGLESGISYREKMYLTSDLKYTTKEDKFRIGISIKFKPF